MPLKAELGCYGLVVLLTCVVLGILAEFWSVFWEFSNVISTVCKALIFDILWFKFTLGFGIFEWAVIFLMTSLDVDKFIYFLLSLLPLSPAILLSPLFCMEDCYEFFSACSDLSSLITLLLKLCFLILAGIVMGHLGHFFFLLWFCDLLQDVDRRHVLSWSSGTYIVIRFEANSLPHGQSLCPVFLLLLGMDQDSSWDTIFFHESCSWRGILFGVLYWWIHNLSKLGWNAKFLLMKWFWLVLI